LKYRAVTDLESSTEEGAQAGPHRSTGASIALERLGPQVLSLVVRLDQEQIAKAKAEGREPTARDRRFDMLRLRHHEDMDWKPIASQYGIPTGTAWHFVRAAATEVRHQAFAEGIDPDQVRVLVVDADLDD
jgi:hypothetical protein